MLERLAIPDVVSYTPRRFEDERGFFSETFNRAMLEPTTGPLDWVQDNHSRSAEAFTLRGLHFQIGAFAQDKLVRCVKGRVFDVAVDIRDGSPTFGRHVSLVLDANIGNQIFVPKGFAHGFLTLEAGCEVMYKVTSYYARDFERAIAWNDSRLAIPWPLGKAAPVLSGKDAEAPSFSASPAYFRYPA